MDSEKKAAAQIDSRLRLLVNGHRRFACARPEVAAHPSILQIFLFCFSSLTRTSNLGKNRFRLRF